MSRAGCTVCEIHAESTFRIEGLCCQHEASMLERRLGGLPGVERLSTDVVRQQLRVCYDAAVTSASAIAEAVAETGMRAWVDREREAAPAPFPVRHQQALLTIATAALVAGIVVRLTVGGGLLDAGLMAIAVVAGGVTTLRRAIFAVRNRRLDMYVLMLVAATGAALIGDWFEAATVVAGAGARASQPRSRTSGDSHADCGRAGRGSDQARGPDCERGPHRGAHGRSPAGRARRSHCLRWRGRVGNERREPGAGHR